MLKKFNEFILEFKETKSNTDILYKDDKLEVKVVKSFTSCKEAGKGTEWCSNDSGGFHHHNLTAVMYRFVFSDGYKLRLTWDYKGGMSTHWGAGGSVGNKYIDYDFIYPQDNDEPFLFYYDKEDRKELVDRIESIPQEVIDKVHTYQESSTTDKSRIYSEMYKEIEKIEVIGVEDAVMYGVPGKKIIVRYRGKEYDSTSSKFRKHFKNKYAFYDTSKTINIYLNDKAKEFMKKNPNH